MSTCGKWRALSSAPATHSSYTFPIFTFSQLTDRRTHRRTHIRPLDTALFAFVHVRAMQFYYYNGKCSTEHKVHGKLILDKSFLITCGWSKQSSSGGSDSIPLTQCQRKTQYMPSTNSTTRTEPVAIRVHSSHTTSYTIARLSTHESRHDNENEAPRRRKSKNVIRENLMYRPTFIWSQMEQVASTKTRHCQSRSNSSPGQGMKMSPRNFWFFFWRRILTLILC